MGRQLPLPLTRRGKPLRKLPAPPEFRLQIAVAAHLDYRLRAGWRWTHFPAGEERHPKVGAKLKAMGLKPGWPDCLLVSPAGLIHCLELKRDETEDLNADQQKFRAHADAYGWPYQVARTVDEALAVLTAWDAILPDLNRPNPKDTL